MFGLRLSFCLGDKKKRLAGASVSVPRGVAGVCGDFVSVRAFVFGSRLSFCLADKKNRLAVSSVSIPRIAPPESSVLMCFCGHLPLLVHLSFSRFLFRRRGRRGWRRNAFTYCISFWLCYAFRGEYDGAARPKPAPKSHWLSGLSSAAAGWAIANSKHRKKPHG